MKHKGTFEDLLVMVRGCGFDVEATSEHENSKQVRTSQGAIVNWYPSTGTLVFQGTKAAKEQLIAAWQSYTGLAPKKSPAAILGVAEPSAPVAPVNPTTANKKVFVVHGHDNVAR